MYISIYLYIYSLVFAGNRLLVRWPFCVRSGNGHTTVILETVIRIFDVRYDGGFCPFSWFGTDDAADVHWRRRWRRRRRIRSVFADSTAFCPGFHCGVGVHNNELIAKITKPAVGPPAAWDHPGTTDGRGVHIGARVGAAKESPWHTVFSPCTAKGINVELLLSSCGTKRTGDEDLYYVQ